ncbi:hypothetical protein GOFOIKOB_6459 [Methylobacterium tardum]|nr:hypothetical protein GOFOIKOB_6459 [Methylobacterium tardum]
MASDARLFIGGVGRLFRYRGRGDGRAADGLPELMTSHAIRQHH